MTYRPVLKSVIEVSQQTLFPIPILLQVEAHVSAFFLAAVAVTSCLSDQVSQHTSGQNSEACAGQVV